MTSPSTVSAAGWSGLLSSPILNNPSLFFIARPISAPISQLGLLFKISHCPIVSVIFLKIYHHQLLSDREHRPSISDGSLSVDYKSEIGERNDAEMSEALPLG
ncbi:unnamed protein product [Cuscuta campestris]|uniref:Uncharacterized protein n=1 Tax=Cuscuta campestris TaxID=132261 RepID=A0A484M046_9ASTE|nr:unnamed protein product [Cuscuta campestris]